MSNLISRSKFPPGGWRFIQPQTRWSTPFPMGEDFNKNVERIIQHRKNNPRFNLPTDFDTVAEELDRYTALRLNNDPAWVVSGQKKTIAPKHRPDPVLEISPDSRNLFARSLAKLVGVKRIAGGARILADWIGEGLVPVKPEVAQARADICIECPKNTTGNFVVSKITKSIAEAIHEQMRVKHDLGLAVNGEEKLNVCNVCLCVNRLKVWAPLPTILEHTSDEVMAEFPEWCWIKKGIG